MTYFASRLSEDGAESRPYSGFSCLARSNYSESDSVAMAGAGRGSGR